LPDLKPGLRLAAAVENRGLQKSNSEPADSTQDLEVPPVALSGIDFQGFQQQLLLEVTLSPHPCHMLCSTSGQASWAPCKLCIARVLLLAAQQLQCSIASHQYARDGHPADQVVVMGARMNRNLRL